VAARPRNLFLYLALTCFFCIIAIFVVDGYMGVYDTVYITVGEREEKVEADFWLQEYNIWTTPANWGDKVFFRYEVDNRRFQSYSANVEVSLWRSQEKVLDLLSEEMQVASFDKGQLEWVVDTGELETVPPEEFVEYTVIIKRGEIERKIILFLDRSSSPEIAVPDK